MPLPSAAHVNATTQLGSYLVELIADPRVGCTSLNLSRLPDGSFRGTIFRHTGKGDWVKGFGQTLEAAVADLKRNLG